MLNIVSIVGSCYEGSGEMDPQQILEFSSCNHLRNQRKTARQETQPKTSFAATCPEINDGGTPGPGEVNWPA